MADKKKPVKKTTTTTTVTTTGKPKQKKKIVVETYRARKPKNGKVDPVGVRAHISTMTFHKNIKKLAKKRRDQV